MSVRGVRPQAPVRAASVVVPAPQAAPVAAPVATAPSTGAPPQLDALRERFQRFFRDRGGGAGRGGDEETLRVFQQL